MLGIVCKNIGKTGRRIRIIGGIIVIAAGVVSCWFSWDMSRTAALLVAGGGAVCGGFMIFEGMMGWCALRALGMKTKF